MKKILASALSVCSLASLLTVNAAAADYSFQTTAPQDYYNSTSYKDIYGAEYNYRGKNVIDYQIPELEYGVQSTTMTGVMERVLLPGLQQEVATGGGAYGIPNGGGPITVLVETDSAPGSSTAVTTPAAPMPPVPSQQPSYTSVSGMEREDGSIGTIQIPSLDISMKVWEGETTASMSKGIAHYSSTSAWDGNVGLCGHNRGAKYVIGSIKNLKVGDVITYTTIFGTRTYKVSMVKKISSTDWSYLQSSAENQITLTTCVENDSSQRWCVQAKLAN